MTNEDARATIYTAVLDGVTVAMPNFAGDPQLLIDAIRASCGLQASRPSPKCGN